jgi:DMSO/TMAO reductase YedYZ molybdopterin-dependent catalytic subunit/thiosulfate reductase cytochrome b subunit
MNQFGYPVWISATHFLNLLFMAFLARSGIQILASFPRLYLKDDCAPGHEIIKFTKKKVPTDRIHQSLDEESDVSPWLALPGGKGANGALGVGRHWHFLVLVAWIATGIVYVVLLFATDQWRRLVPTSWSIIPGAIQSADAYLHFHLAPPTPGYPYDPLQQLTYFLVVFVLAPLQIATGAAMSPAIIGRFPWYPRLFGNRQTARTIHFMGLIAFAAFVIGHTFMVVVHGLPREWARIVLSSDHANQELAVVVGILGLLVVVGTNVFVTMLGRRDPRSAQRVLGRAVDPLQHWISSHLQSRQHYKSSDITSYFWVNGYPPPDPVYKDLAANGFRDWTLLVGGQIERELRLSLDDLRHMPSQTQITKHNCIQGWTGVAQWTGVPLTAFIKRCRPHANARYLVFYAYDDKALTQVDSKGLYYETLDLKLADAPQAMLAYEFNGKPLPIEHGAPLRLRVETQLGFKMVKWIRAISFQEDYRNIGLGFGGWREDYAYYSRVVGI